MLKVTARNNELLESTIQSIMNCASVLCMSGRMPSDKEIAEPNRLGRWWYIEPDNSNYRVHLFPLTNDYWAHIRNKTDVSCEIDFNIRYDNEMVKENALYVAIAAFFPYEVKHIGAERAS